MYPSHLRSQSPHGGPGRDRAPPGGGALIETAFGSADPDHLLTIGPELTNVKKDNTVEMHVFLPPFPVAFNVTVDV